MANAGVSLVPLGYRARQRQSKLTAEPSVLSHITAPQPLFPLPQLLSPCSLSPCSLCLSCCSLCLSCCSLCLSSLAAGPSASAPWPLVLLPLLLSSWSVSPWSSCLSFLTPGPGPPASAPQLLSSSVLVLLPQLLGPDPGPPASAPRPRSWSSCLLRKPPGLLACSRSLNVTCSCGGSSDTGNDGPLNVLTLTNSCNNGNNGNNGSMVIRNNSTERCCNRCTVPRWARSVNRKLRVTRDRPRPPPEMTCCYHFTFWNKNTSLYVYE